MNENPLIREHPILFSSEMVRAILEERKIMTRRVVKVSSDYEFDGLIIHSRNNVPPWKLSAKFLKPNTNTGILLDCLYGQLGDHLWVRETFREGAGFYGQNPSIFYRADEEWNKNAGWKSSIFMPRWASRITLEITNIRVERLHDISEEDAIREGAEVEPCDQTVLLRDYSNNPNKFDGNWFQEWSEELNNFVAFENICRSSFQTLWDSINGKKYPWNSNPWVWVIEFKRI